MRRVFALTVTALLLAAPTTAAMGSGGAASKSYPNCKALNRVYPHGVGRVGARDHTSGSPPVTNFKRSNRLYYENRARDRDGDKIACEKL
jgi:hypothetical protein